MLSRELADAFAEHWIAAWNAHDLDAILDHYEDDFVMASPVIVQLTGEASGRLQGRSAVGDYWSLALSHNPDLHFELLHVLRGVDSVTLVYNGVRGLSAEVFHFGPSGKVTAAFAHYLP